MFDGLVPKTEADEYVIIRNEGETAGSLDGWTLVDSDDGRPSFEFPAHILGAGETVRVYTNEVHLEYGGFTFGSSVAIWNNENPDQAALLDPDGNNVSAASYPPGC